MCISRQRCQVKNDGHESVSAHQDNTSINTHYNHMIIMNTHRRTRSRGHVCNASKRARLLATVRSHKVNLDNMGG